MTWSSKPDRHINPDGLLDYILGHLKPTEAVILQEAGS